MKEAIKKTWEKHPLAIIILSALFFRVIAVIFSKGYGFHDDHFLVIEPTQSWVDGYDYNNWLPQNSGKQCAPEGPSMFYPGIHYLIFLYLKWRGVLDPENKMYIIRALHAVYSLIVVIYGYKIAKHYGGDKVAKQAGLLLAVYWFIPMLSVHNLVEMVCIPPLIVATWLMINPESNQKTSTYFWVGVLCAIACNIRFQSALFVGGMGLLMLFNKKWKFTLLISLGFILVFCLFQGGIDMLIWHHPFAEFSEYIRYNIVNAHNYIIGPWYNYFLLVGGMLLPPVGLFLIFGFGRSFRKYPILFWPSFLFFLFHSFFPNKQERFILPIVPFVIILGCIGWAEFVAKSKYWQGHQKLLKGCWTFFWVINIILLPVISTTYTKKNRVESMAYLGHQKDLQAIMIEESIHDDFVLPPKFYIGHNSHIVGVTSGHNLYHAYMEYKDDTNRMVHPNYVVFFDQEKIDQRVSDFKKMFPNATYETTISPSFIDKVMTFLNPVNRNQTTYIYKFDDRLVQLPKDTTHSSGH
ncbi:MAG TPA: glycosyltransferase family 39 protein [Bacteroidia bacterium]|jgi:hypothetical protein|nr:glycosyltransferase family 39 protein [Bacteroidia bacterium]